MQAQYVRAVVVMFVAIMHIACARFVFYISHVHDIIIIIMGTSEHCTLTPIRSGIRNLNNYVDQKSNLCLDSTELQSS